MRRAENRRERTVHNRAKRAWLSAYAAGMVLLVVWLLFANQFLGKIANAGKVKRVDFEEVAAAYTKDPVHFSLTGGKLDYYKGQLLDEVSLSGWALCETKGDNENRTVSLLLHDAENANCYELKPKITLRPDVPENWPVILSWEEMDIPTTHVGMEIAFSTLEIKNGVYDVAVCCRENESNYGIAYTDYRIEKSKDGVQVYQQGGHRMTELVEPNSNGDAALVEYIDIVEADENGIGIWGWAFVETLDCGTQTVIVELTDRNGTRTQYAANYGWRGDVAKNFGSEKYVRSQYYLNIPRAELSDGDYTLRILVENNGNVWQSKDYAMTLSSNVTLQ